MKDPNLAVLELVLSHLGELANEFVFVGGAMVGLYIEDKAVAAVRPTFDIDCVVEVVNQNNYYEIVDRLRKKGFNEASEGKVICRFKKGDLILDVMPTNHDILGFTNQWYIEGVKNRKQVQLGNGMLISIFSVPYFIASKIDAFKARGREDFRASHDIEDIVTVFDGSPNISEKIKSSPERVRSYLASELKMLLENEDFQSSIEGHISDRLNIANRATVVSRRIRSCFS